MSRGLLCSRTKSIEKGDKRIILFIKQKPLDEA